jgi:fucose permease
VTRSGRILLWIAFLAFVSLGLPDGVLGIAWPSVRRTFDLPVSQLGVLLGAATAGYLVSAFSSGQVVVQIGVGRLLLWSSVTMVVTSLGYALAPRWWVMVVCGVLGGLGAGAIDAGINAFAAARCRPRQVNWLHACYGVGAMLGPLLMTSVVALGWGWRWGYAVIGLILAGMALCFALTVDRWDASGRDADTGGQVAEPDVGVIAALKRPPVWTHVALFFVYTGLEVSAGQWTYSLLTEARDVAPAMAGIAVGAYWGSLTLGRLVFGALTRRYPPEILLRFGMGAALPAAALIWLVPGPVGGLLGLAALGFSLAPIYPLLISLTPVRVGAAYATHAVGFQVAAGYLGAAALPGAAGVLARVVGLEVIAPLLLATAVAVLVLHEMALWEASGRRALIAMPVGATRESGYEGSAGRPRTGLGR